MIDPRLKSQLAAMSEAQRHEWMLKEANRLIEARGAVSRPATPVWTNQIHRPEDVKVDHVQRGIESASSELIRKLRERDNADDAARW